MNTATIKRRKASPHLPYDEHAQEEFTWDQAQPAYAAPDPVYTTSGGQYASTDAAYADPAGPYTDPAGPYADPDLAYAPEDALYAPQDAAYAAENAAEAPEDASYATSDGRYVPVDVAYGPADAGYDAGQGGFGRGDGGYSAGPDGFSGEDADYGTGQSNSDTGFGDAEAGYAVVDGRYRHADAGYAGEPDDRYDPADADYGDPDAAYAPAEAAQWDRCEASAADLEPGPVDVYAPARPDGSLRRRDDRTATLVNQGRTSAAERQVGRSLKIAATVLIAAGLVVGLVMMLLPGPGPTWPAGVAKVQGEIAKACQNPDVASEPGQVNFACAKSTRQILWVFSLLTSGDNPNFADAKNGRVGIEPITPRQGGIVAWSLNLHHPYQPTNPIDSLQVAARAINNIIGGATVTGTYGNPVVQAGLESSQANCLRYTGSSKVNAHKGFPGLCARPISSLAGQAALVADVYQKWIVGADPKAAQNAATLYENARNPGSPEVQAILKHLPNSGR